MIFNVYKEVEIYQYNKLTTINQQRRDSMANQNNNFEATLFNTADKLRKNIDAAEYKNVVLGLIFLKYISDSFLELFEQLEQDDYSDPEDRDEYLAENVFFVPRDARWASLQAKAKLPEIGVAIDDAMNSIEKENSELKNVLPKVFAKPNLDKAALGQLIDVISDIELKAENEHSKDLLGRVYEYFLGEFASAEGKKGGQFYTPKSIVKLMVELIEPYKGRVYDPACGSGGMFVMSEKFVEEYQGNIQDITIYGQESNQTTWKLSKMNLAIRGINSKFVLWNTEGSFLKDTHPDLKADFILANPPFNQSEWGQDILQEDGRWKYGLPPAGNANFAWMQHMLYHLAPHGVMTTVLANGSLSSNTSPEDIEKIEQTYHHWRINGGYEDIKGYCKSAKREEIEKHNFILTPGRYVGIPDEEDDGIPFEDKMRDLTATLARQIEKEKVLDNQLKEQLAKIGFVL